MVQPNISMLLGPSKPEFMNKAFYKVKQKTQKLDFWSNPSQILISGMAVKQNPDGECEDRTYVNGKLEGQATVIFPDGSKEMRNYQNNKPQGQAILFAANGDRIGKQYKQHFIMLIFEEAKTLFREQHLFYFHFRRTNLEQYKNQKGNLYFLSQG